MLTLDGITMRFGATLALDGASLSVEPGEVHALVGENGSGKSTLMRILAGAVARDSGSLTLEGRAFEPTDPWNARTAGIAMIHQELSLCPDLSVAENVMLGVERGRYGWISNQNAIVRDALAKLGHDDLDPSRKVGSLPISQRQTVEIARALVLGSTVIVFDEPTSSLTQSDAEHLFAIIDSLREDGHAIIYISHFFDEIRRVADRFTVLRDGRNVGTGVTSQHTDAEIISMMVGRHIGDLYPRSARKPGDVLLAIDKLCGYQRPSDATITVRAGEVVGIAGLAGAGRTELLRAVFGLDRVRTGAIQLKAFFGPFSPAQRWRQGAGMLSEDRKEEGLALNMTVAENLLLTRLPNWITRSWEAREARRSIEALAVKTRGPFQPVGALSGGNQQKVALARLLAHDVDVFLLDEPTRGIDVASKEQIYNLIDQAAQRGKAVLMVSSYLPELLGVCDRIAVMTRGRLGDALPAASWTQESLMQEAVGA